jgi:putative flippase GtrA
MRHELSAVARFGAVGSIGFLVDAAVLNFLSLVLLVDVVAARLCSFAVAVTVTWLLNRTYVFDRGAMKRSRRPASTEFFQYLVVQGLGGALNLCVFVTLVLSFPAMRDYPTLPLAVASVVALSLNYAGSRFWVFGAVKKKTG